MEKTSEETTMGLNRHSKLSEGLLICLSCNIVGIMSGLEGKSRGQNFVIPDQLSVLVY